MAEGSQNTVEYQVPGTRMYETDGKTRQEHCCNWDNAIISKRLHTAVDSKNT